MRKYNRMIKGTFFAALLVLAAGCQQDDEIVGRQTEWKDRVVLSLSDGKKPLTRANESDHYTKLERVEGTVNHIDVFLLQDDKVTRHERLTPPADGTGKVALEALKSTFNTNPYDIYVIANWDDSQTTKLADVKTLTDLKSLEMTTPNVHVTGWEIGDPNLGDSPKTFVMDGHTEAVLNDEKTTNTEVTVELKRAAAKITVVLECKGADYRFIYDTEDTDNDGNKDEIADEGTILRRAMNLASTSLAIAPETGTYYQSKTWIQNNSDNVTAIVQPTATSKQAVITAYSYYNNWETQAANQYESYLIVRVPVECYETKAGSTEKEWVKHTDNYYKIPLGGKQEEDGTPVQTYSLERNHSYFIKGQIAMLGSELPDDKVTLPTVFFKVQDWAEETIEIGGDDGNRPKYLTLSKNEYILRGLEDDNSILFASSSKITGCNVTKVTFIDKNGIEKELSNHNVTVKPSTSTGLNGNLIINSALPEGTLTVRTIKVEVTNEDGLTQELTITQYPLEYVTNTLGWYSYRSDFGGTTYETPGTNRYIAAKWNGTSWNYYDNGYDIFYDANDNPEINFVSRVHEIGYNKINVYCWKQSTFDNNWNLINTDYNGTTPLTPGTSGSDGINCPIIKHSGYEVYPHTSVSNSHIYHVHITSTPEVNKDETLNYVLGLPHMDANGFTDGSTENGNIVSPSFMIASQLGAVQAPFADLEAARQHCREYVEVAHQGYEQGDARDAVTYSDWRLPTRAELLIIQKYQGEGKSDAIDEILTGTHYWCAEGPLNLTTRKIDWDGRGSSGTAAIRCIRDAYVEGKPNK